MPLWTFYDYITDRGHNPIKAWYDAQAPDVRAAFDVVVRILGNTSDWENKRVVEYFRELTGPHVGLSEIRFYVDEPRPRRGTAPRRRFRPVGIWRPEQLDFIFILGAEELGKRYIPAGAFDEAMRLRRQFNQGRGEIREHQ